MCVNLCNVQYTQVKCGQSAWALPASQTFLYTYNGALNFLSILDKLEPAAPVPDIQYSFSEFFPRHGEAIVRNRRGSIQFSQSQGKRREVWLLQTRRNSWVSRDMKCFLPVLLSEAGKYWYEFRPVLAREYFCLCVPQICLVKMLIRINFIKIYNISITTRKLC